MGNLIPGFPAAQLVHCRHSWHMGVIIHPRHLLCTSAHFLFAFTSSFSPQVGRKQLVRNRVLPATLLTFTLCALSVSSFPSIHTRPAPDLANAGPATVAVQCVHFMRWLKHSSKYRKLMLSICPKGTATLVMLFRLKTLLSLKRDAVSHVHTFFFSTTPVQMWQIYI